MPLHLPDQRLPVPSHDFLDVPWRTVPSVASVLFGARIGPEVAIIITDSDRPVLIATGMPQYIAEHIAAIHNERLPK